MAETFASSPAPAVTRAATASPSASTNASNPSLVAHETACVVASDASRRAPGRSILLRTTRFAPRCAHGGSVFWSPFEVASSTDTVRSASLARASDRRMPSNSTGSVVSRTPAVSATITLYPPSSSATSTASRVVPG